MSGLVDTSHSAYPLRAVDRVCDLLDVLAANPSGATLSAVAAAADLPKSSTFRYLAALEIRGYVVRTDDGYGYRLAPVARGRRGTRSERLERLVAVAKPLLARLATRESGVWTLAAQDGTGIRFLWVSPWGQSSWASPVVGEHSAVHTSAPGKAIAAQLSDEAVLGILGLAGMPPRTSHTLASKTEFLRELHRVRGEGFAVSDQERLDDVRGVAVPIGGETMALGVERNGAPLSPQRVAATVRQLRRGAVVLARELRSDLGDGARRPAGAGLLR